MAKRIDNPILHKAMWVVNSILPISGSCKTSVTRGNIVVTGPVADITSTWKKLVDRLREFEPELNEQIKVDSKIGADKVGKIVVSLA